MLMPRWTFTPAHLALVDPKLWILPSNRTAPHRLGTDAFLLFGAGWSIRALWTTARICLGAAPDQAGRDHLHLEWNGVGVGLLAFPAADVQVAVAFEPEHVQARHAGVDDPVAPDTGLLLARPLEQ